ncbi:MAG: hypothetical protein S4CHLAM20_05460 [Chlamydiia bacterium]|nr:hypothetical protein [Chlamydiia bacterium]
MKKESFNKQLNFFKQTDWMLKKHFFIATLLVPVICLSAMALHIYKRNNYLKKLQEEVLFSENLVQNIKKASVCPKGSSCENYVETVLGHLRFLSEDRKRLSMICSEVSDNNLFPKVKERLSFLQSDQNKMSFYSEDGIQGKIWKLKSPVEMNIRDIKKLITLVEGRSLGEFYPNPSRPNIYFLKLNIKNADKKKPANVFTVDLEILQKR